MNARHHELLAAGLEGLPGNPQVETPKPGPGETIVEIIVSVNPVVGTEQWGDLIGNRIIPNARTVEISGQAMVVNAARNCGVIPRLRERRQPHHARVHLGLERETGRAIVGFADVPQSE